jgi:fumarate reductase flavoprotein subunit
MKPQRLFFVFSIVALVVTGLIGCASTGSASGSGSTVSMGTASGTASAAAQGFGGTVTVSITMADGYITDVRITGDNETPTVGGIALARAPGIIKRNNSGVLDAISGATITTNAISTAAQEAISKIVTGN